MPLILHIDTATEHASICLSKDKNLVALAESAEQKNHASFVQSAIVKLLKEHDYSLPDIDAVSVTIGPGSYTGLRVGLASAKGICYALDKPLITMNTLRVMATAAQEQCRQTQLTLSPEALFCPMIDARRMEVFTGLYSLSLEEIRPPHALIIVPDTFLSLYPQQPLVLSGSGYPKLISVITSPHITWLDIQHNASHMVSSALIAYQSGSFADIAYCEPLYVKEFFDFAKQKP